MLKNFFSSASLFSLLAFLAALVPAYFATPLARRLAVKCRCVDAPDAKRKLQKEPVPYFGGLAIAFGFSLSFLLFSYLYTGALSAEIMTIFIGGLSVLLIGLVDDLYDMRPLLKFFLQLLVCGFTAHFGFSMEYITLFGVVIRFGIFSEAVTVLWLAAIVNAVNLIDGLDGLACGVSVLEAFTLLATAIYMGSPVCAVASAALFGAALGFLPHNFTKATIYMGDAGAMFIGYVMGCISVSGLFKSQALFSIIVPAMIFALPVIETVTSFFRRLMQGKSPFSADRKHLHYVLIENGFTPTGSVIVLMSASALFCIASVLFLKWKLLSLFLFLLTIVMLTVLKYDKKFLTRFGQRKGKKPSEKKDGDPV